MKSGLVFCLCCSLFSATGLAQLQLNPIWQSGMVVQANQPILLNGYTNRAMPITVTFGHFRKTLPIKKYGSWRLPLPPQQPGAIPNLVIQQGKDSIVLDNLLAGEVWLCSGQSNMEWTMALMKSTYPLTLDTANDKQLRFAVVNRTVSNTPQDQAAFSQPWQAISQSSIPNCSAVAYWFGQHRRKDTGVPIGLILASWGGTPAESWTPRDHLDAFPHYTKRFDSLIRPLPLSSWDSLQHSGQRLFQAEQVRESVQHQSYRSQFAADTDTAWRWVDFPDNWEETGFPNVDGIGWYQLLVSIPQQHVGKAATLHLPAIDDSDSTYVNGTWVGSNTVWNEPRQYPIPPALLTEKTLVSIRVQDDGGGGGPAADPRQAWLLIDNDTIWLPRQASFSLALKKNNPVSEFGNIHQQPAVLFNGMIAPLRTLGLQGVLWYQGENNVSRAQEYRRLFPTLIESWRALWEKPALPFLFVQLAAYGQPTDKPGAASRWAELRDAQQQTLTLPNTAMATAIDLGDPTNIHPTRKKEVGERLARLARELPLPAAQRMRSGPQAQQVSLVGDALVVSFDQVGTGIYAIDQSPMALELEDELGTWTWAQGVIRDNKLWIQVPKPASIKTIRYGWANTPRNLTLYRKDGFPVLPFQLRPTP